MSIQGMSQVNIAGWFSPVEMCQSDTTNGF